MLEEVHRELADRNRNRLAPRFPDDGDWRAELKNEHEIRVLESDVLDLERAHIADRAATAPTDASTFLRWFTDLEATGPGQHDPLFPWLAEQATVEDMRWFLRQEVAGEAGFEDLVAMSQIKMPERPKLELARNYWDEMGRGNAAAMHGPLLAKLATSLELDKLDVPIVWESLALGNIMLALASSRRFAYHALGALGVIELTAPDRAAHVNAGLKRLGIASDARHYYALHATLDVKHSAAWNAEVLVPMVVADPRVARAFAEGALLRLEAGRRCFERYRAQLCMRDVHAVAA